MGLFISVLIAIPLITIIAAYVFGAGDQVDPKENPEYYEESSSNESNNEEDLNL